MEEDRPLKKRDVLVVGEVEGAVRLLTSASAGRVQLRAGTRLRFTPPVIYRATSGEHLLWVGTAVYTLEGQLKFANKFWGTTVIEVTQLVPGQWARVVGIPA